MEAGQRPDAARSGPRLAAWLAFVAAFGTLSYVGNLREDSGLPDEPLYDSSFFAASIVGFGLMVFVAFLISIGAPRIDLFALRPPQGWGRALGIATGILVAVFALSALLGIFLDPGAEQGLLPETWPPPDTGVFALNVAAVVVAAPVAEELVFRGLGFSLLERFGTAAAAAISAAAWAAAHGLIEAFPIIFALGVGLALLRRASGSILPGIALHAAFNGIAVIAAVASAAGG